MWSQRIFRYFYPPRRACKHKYLQGRFRASASACRGGFVQAQVLAGAISCKRKRLYERFRASASACRGGFVQAQMLAGAITCKRKRLHEITPASPYACTRPPVLPLYKTGGLGPQTPLERRTQGSPHTGVAAPRGKISYLLHPAPPCKIQAMFTSAICRT